MYKKGHVPEQPSLLGAGICSVSSRQGYGSEACNLDRDRTHMRVEQSSEGFAVGNWVRVVDYVVGDTLQFDPLAEKS